MVRILMLYWECDKQIVFTVVVSCDMERHKHALGGWVYGDKDIQYMGF